MPRVRQDRRRYGWQHLDQSPGRTDGQLQCAFHHVPRRLPLGCPGTKSHGRSCGFDHRATDNIVCTSMSSSLRQCVPPFLPTARRAKQLSPGSRFQISFSVPSRTSVAISFATELHEVSERSGVSSYEPGEQPFRGPTLDGQNNSALAVAFKFPSPCPLVPLWPSLLPRSCTRSRRAPESALMSPENSLFVGHRSTGETTSALAVAFKFPSPCPLVPPWRSLLPRSCTRSRSVPASAGCRKARQRGHPRARLRSARGISPPGTAMPESPATAPQCKRPEVMRA